MKAALFVPCYVDAFFPESKSTEIRDFVSRYTSTFNQEPTPMEALAYDAAGILENVLSHVSPQATRADVRDSLKKVRGFQGVTGKISPQPIGSYHYLKEKKDGGGIPCSVEVFTLEVTKQVEDWPEKGAREIVWLPADQAAARVTEPGLRQLLKGFRKQHPPSRHTG